MGVDYSFQVGVLVHQEKEVTKSENAISVANLLN
jgi:hypothetical protein